MKWLTENMSNVGRKRQHKATARRQPTASHQQTEQQAIENAAPGWALCAHGPAAIARGHQFGKHLMMVTCFFQVETRVLFLRKQDCLSA